MNTYKSSAELKAIAKEHMFGKYTTAIGITLIVGMITGFVTVFSTLFLDTATLLGTILNFIITFVISVLSGLFVSGEKYFYLKISCGRPVTVSDVFYGFKLFPNKAVLLQLYLSIWLNLALLPMTIFSYMILKNPENTMLMLPYSLSMIFYLVVSVLISLLYSQSFYLLHDFPNYTVKELLTMSRKLMKGNKGRYFYMMVSFLPMILLSFVSCGIALLWVAPYMNTAYTEFFLDLMKNQQKVPA